MNDGKQAAKPEPAAPSPSEQKALDEAGSASKWCSRAISDFQKRESVLAARESDLSKERAGVAEARQRLQALRNAVEVMMQRADWASIAIVVGEIKALAGDAL